MHFLVEVDTFKVDCKCFLRFEKMAKINKVLELPNTLISNVHDAVKINKAILIDIPDCLQDAHEKIEFLELQS